MAKEAKAKIKARPLYDCLLMLDGSRDNTIVKNNVTAAELAVLRVLHSKGGIEPIYNVQATGKGVERTDQQERARLAARYRAPGKANGTAVMNSLFGVGGQLPMEYEAPEQIDPDAEPEADTIIDIEEEAPDDAPEKTEKTKKKGSFLDEGV